MAGADHDIPSPFVPLQAELARMRRSNLKAAIDNVDMVIEQLIATRNQVAEEHDGHRISMAMTTLQNPVKQRFEAITEGLKDVTKAQRSFGKALDKALPHRELPMETDVMAGHPDLINRAIAMHMLREGQFGVATTFLREAQYQTPAGDTVMAAARTSPPQPPPPRRTRATDEDGDDDMQGTDGPRGVYTTGLPSEDLQDRFAEMYEILRELKSSNLVPAIQWAHAHSAKLESKGSNLEFELCKLQFIWLFKGAAVNGLPDDVGNGQSGAFQYARRHFGRFQRRHLREISQLSSALIYAPNIEGSPYRHLFEIESAFDDVCMAFTREFCSLLGLSAESPLYVAVTAGAIALPRLIKYTTYMKEKKTEWTTENELAFETPLPPSMIYHPIFVCPVSKEQTTENNPPMLMPCGHVLCKESLHNILKADKYKCPYCPQEGHLNEAIEIKL